MKIPHISVSRKGVWTTCQQQYKYHYHLQLPSPEPEPFYFVYGTLIHKIAEEYVINKGEKLLKEIANDVLKGVIPMDVDKNGNSIFAPKLPKEYSKRMPGHLKAIQNLSDQIGLDGETEWKFEYDLDPPNGKRIKGFIDRLIRKNDKFWIIDYKTTKKGRWRKKTVVNDLQLRCYSRVVQKQFDVPAENIKAALYYVEGGELVSAKYSNQSLLDAEQELLSTFKEIENTPPDQAWGNVTDNCNRCDYRKICPFLRIT